jgi:putative heme iron utilization protein
MIGFSTAHQQVAVGLQVDLDVREQIGAEQGLQRNVNARGIDRVARRDRQIGENRPRLDTLVALDRNALNDA